MITVTNFENLGTFTNDWLNAHYHFSFAGYHDPRKMGLGPLRVWNDDTIQANTGFDPHPHRDMEIITYVRRGAISHEDSIGNKGRTEAGDVQVMHAGTGIVHAERNLEDGETTLFQIWIIPDERGGTPHWGAAKFPKDDRSGKFVALASGIKGDEALPIRANARVSGATLKAGESLTYETSANRHLYLVPATGRIQVETLEANARDGVAITGVDRFTVTALADAELVLVDAV